MPRLACLGISGAGKETLLILWTHGGYLHVCEGEAASGDLGEQYIPRGDMEVNPQNSKGMKERQGGVEMSPSPKSKDKDPMTPAREETRAQDVEWTSRDPLRTSTRLVWGPVHLTKNVSGLLPH